MKVLVLNGSPQRDRSDTMHMTRAFLDGMNAVSVNEIHIIHVIDVHIEYCTGCFICKKNGGECVIDNDMKEILSEILQSDVVIFSFGLYSYGMPAPLKNLVDRMMPLSSWTMIREENDKYGHIAKKGFSALHTVMICGCGYPNAKHNFEGAVRQFELKFPMNHLIITVPESTMFNIPQAAEFTAPRLSLLKKAGEQYALSFAADEPLLEEIRSPMIPEEVYARFANSEG